MLYKRRFMKATKDSSTQLIVTTLQEVIKLSFKIATLCVINQWQKRQEKNAYKKLNWAQKLISPKFRR